ncbi:serine/threonine protein kinase [Nannocystaceae bacterium ST9]
MAGLSAPSTSSPLPRERAEASSSSPIVRAVDDSVHLHDHEEAKRAVEQSKRGHRPRPADETFKLGRYAITGKIASGGMATVYRGRLEGQGGFAREFAIKVIHPHLAAAEGFRDRFYDEARVASRVSHPNVVATIDSDFDHGYHFLVLELIDGITLRQLQVTGQERTTALGEGPYRLEPGEAARVVCDAARGLHAVHTTVDESGEAMEVVHRDLSPHNLMLDVTGRTVLIDLGLAKARGQLGHTQTGVLCGKLPYMSPEQSRVEPLDARSDVFSLGSVLFELATGLPPFGDDHTPNTLENLRRCDPIRLGEMLSAARIPDWLNQIILTCLRAEPGDRYPSAEALSAALDEGMRRAGVNQANVRNKLARRTREIRSLLGPTITAAPLLPLIGADPTGPYAALGLPGWRPWARGLALVAAGAMVVLIGLGIRNDLTGRSNAATAADDWTPTLSSDALGPDTGAEPQQVVTPHEVEPLPAARQTTRARPEPEREPLEELEDETPVKRKRVGNKRDPITEFKANPYD